VEQIGLPCPPFLSDPPRFAGSLDYLNSGNATIPARCDRLAISYMLAIVRGILAGLSDGPALLMNADGVAMVVHESHKRGQCSTVHARS
jgi:hypothetical protein